MSAVSPASGSSKISLGPYVAGSGFCEYCWGKGFNETRNRHSKSSCIYMKRALAKKAERAAMAGGVSALAASSEGASAVPSPALSDAAIVAGYEQFFN